VPVFRTNTAYSVRLTVSTQAGGGNLTGPWSPSVDFTVQAGTQVQQGYAGPQILGPEGGATTGLSPGFAWAQIAGATEYSFVLATDATLEHTVGDTPVRVAAPSYQVSGLDHGTTYFWGVKVSRPTESLMTVGTFTTKEAPVETVLPAPTTIQVLPSPPTESPPQALPDVIVQVPETAPLIPERVLWAAIGIGAALVLAVLVLICAVLVLITRTRHLA